MDNDGLYDGFDNNTSSWDATNNSMTAESHPDVQAGGTSEQDWREGPDNDLDGIADAIDLDDDNDGIPDINECEQNTLPNAGFETYNTGDASSSGGSPAYYLFPESSINGWETTSGDALIEIWASGHNGVSSYEGGSHAEINATEDAQLFQDLATLPGSEISWSVWHRGRSGEDTAIVLIGPAGGSLTQVQEMRTGNTGWVNYSGTYTVPTGQTTTRFGLESTGVASGNATIGNFIDLFEVDVCSDHDGDGIPSHKDLDSDADGIADIIEAGGTDSDGDGQVDYGTAGDPSTMTDADSDGLFDTVDDQDSGSGGGEVTSGTALTDPDSDSDGLENRIDIDSDADGITDNNEAQTSSGYTAPTGSDTDGDGIDNAYDGDDNTTTGIGGGTGTAISPTNTDEEADLPDYLDTDSDEDGESDTIEAYDTDDDGVADTTPAGTDTDGDGLDDNFDSNNLISAASTNPNDNGETPGSFRDTDIVGGEPNWREPTAGGAPAPIELLSFSVYSLSNGTVKIRWQTLTETNNDFFTIERSRDAEYWEELAYIKGAGNSQETLNYQEIDRQPFLETSYYRLKQTDFNGDFSYSQIMDIYMDPGGVMPLSVFPNPTKGDLTLEGAPDELTSFTFYDVTGKDVTALVRLIERTDFRISVDISKLPRGVYLLKTENETVKVERE